MDIDALSQEIDAIDKEVLKLLNQRVKAASKIGEIKKEHDAPVYVPAREEAVFKKLIKVSDGPLGEAEIRSIFREIISASISLEKKMAIAFLGPEATFTHQAAVKNFGSRLNYLPYPAIEAVFDAVEKREVDYGVVPIENSAEGTVFHTLEALVDSELKIVAQITLPMEHCLIAKGSIEAVERVYSKSEALEACRDWLRRTVPNAALIETSHAGRAVELARDEPGAAAIGSAFSATFYSMPMLAKGIQGGKNDEARFFIVGREMPKVMGGGLDKTSVLLAIPNAPGMLAKAIEPLSREGVDITKIESRPNRKRPWDSVFFIDFIGHWEDAPVQAAMQAISEASVEVKWLGSYPASSKL